MSEIKSFRDRSCVLVVELVESEEFFLEKVIELWALGNKIYTEAWNTEFHVFGAISSDTDHLPLNRVRDKCSERFLVRSDEELKEIISSYEFELEKAYKDILSMHGRA